MIFPSLFKFTKRSKYLKGGGKFSSIANFPFELNDKKCDRKIISQLQQQPLCNDISKHTKSPFKEDLTLMAELKGAFCKIKPIDNIAKIITKIHNTLNSKEAPEIKNWLHILTGIHPEIDKKIIKLNFWKTRYSENMGNNTILYSPDYSTVDVNKWGKITPCVNNDINIKSDDRISYIRDSMRQKLDSPVVEYIQNSNHLTTGIMMRNLIFEKNLTTDTKMGGSETVMFRPIPPGYTHGCSLNNDVYHNYRMKLCRPACKINAIAYLRRNGSHNDKLVNHLTPLVNKNTTNGMGIVLEDKLEIENNLPVKKSEKLYFIDNSGQPLLKSPSRVNNDVLKPEIINE